MSVERLALKGIGPNDVSIEKLFDESYGLEFKIEVGGIKLRSWYPAVLDRSQAHLLMLYLQEHLKTKANR